VSQQRFAQRLGVVGRGLYRQREPTHINTQRNERSSGEATNGEKPEFTKSK
jgi:hypothetical protein